MVETEQRRDGFTVIEALVSLTLLSMILILLLATYEKLVASYRYGADAVNTQQNVRVAFSRMVDELRMAGVGSDPDGDPSRPDERLEGIWNGAVTFRSDLDGRDPSRKYDPELTLGGPAMLFSTVTTGNDEIVTYALGSSRGGGGSISFSADVRGVPRDGVVETMNVSRVHLIQMAPPYTLYRMTVSRSGSSVLRRPLADGILGLSFTWFDRNGNQVTPVGGGEDQAARLVRDSVAVVDVSLTGQGPAGSAAIFTLKTRLHLRGRRVVGGAWFDPDSPGGPAQSL